MALIDQSILVPSRSPGICGGKYGFFAVGMLLFVMTFGLNLVSAWLRERYREEYA